MSFKYIKSGNMLSICFITGYITTITGKSGAYWVPPL